MGKHSDGNPPQTDEKDYDPKHKLHWDAYDWAEYTNATGQTQTIPAQSDGKKGKK